MKERGHLKLRTKTITMIKYICFCFCLYVCMYVVIWTNLLLLHRLSFIVNRLAVLGRGLILQVKRSKARFNIYRYFI